MNNISEKDSVNVELHNSYQALLNYAKEHQIPLNIKFETFQREYFNGQYKNLESYLTVYYNILKPEKTLDTRLEFTKESQWYYNTGTKLPLEPRYDKYNLLSNLRAGDIVYEANGGFGITGHIAIVEGLFYDYTLNKRYVRLIEAIGQGVVRSVLDDQRFDDRAAEILRTNLPYYVCKKVIAFCIGQLGKSYKLDFMKETSADEADWYCSELVWAAYYNQGLNIETQSIVNEPGVTPRDIKNCDKISTVVV